MKDPTPKHKEERECCFLLTLVGQEAEGFFGVVFDIGKAKKGFWHQVGGPSPCGAVPFFGVGTPQQKEHPHVGSLLLGYPLLWVKGGPKNSSRSRKPSDGIRR